MTKKQIKQLVKLSFVRNNLDPKRVLRFAKIMKRSELRDYVKYLKAQIASKQVIIQVTKIEEIDKPKIQKQFGRLFPNKKIHLEENRDLILGLRVIDNDKIYDFNLKNYFEDMGSYLKEI